MKIQNTIRRFRITSLLILAGFLAHPAWAESARFTPHTNGTVLDSMTGLMWQKSDSFHDGQKGMNWYQALEYVGRKNAEKYAGFSDWRLPTLEEVRNIWTPKKPVTGKDGDPLGLPEGFSAGGSYYIWTGTERNLDNAWYFGLGQKEEYWNLKDLGDLDQGVKMVRKAR